MLRIYAAAALLTCAVPAVAAEPAKPQPQLDPLEFFTGETRGAGTIKVMMKPPAAVRAETRGTPDGKGGMTLDQKVFEAGQPVRIRRWVLRPTSKTTLTGTVTDAAGPVTGNLSGNRLHLKYRMKGGLAAELFMYLQPDRRTLRNQMIVRKWGMVVARIDETVRKLP
jgi:hypothetical protein